MWASWRRQPSAAAVLGQGFVPEIESLRGIAIALVVAMHVGGWLGVGQSNSGALSPLLTFVRGGHTGVSLFFILSGFLLGRPFVVEARGGKRLNRAAYYARRVLRIMPLYVAAVAVGAVLSARQPADVLRGVPYLFFLEAVAGMTTPLRPYSDVWWSLATEVQFYAVLPLLPFFLSFERRRLAAVAVLTYVAIFAAFLAGYLHLGTADAQLKLYQSLFGRLPMFASGVMAAWLCERWGRKITAWANASDWIRGGGGDLALIAALSCLGALLAHVTAVGYFAMEIRANLWHVPEALLWTAVMLLVLLVPLWTRPLLANRIWEHLGRISYSLYLVHYPMIFFGLGIVSRLWPDTFVGGRWHVAAAATLIIAMSVGLSLITYHVIERPFLQRKRRFAWWSATPSVRPATAATEPAPSLTSGGQVN